MRPWECHQVKAGITAVMDGQTEGRKEGRSCCPSRLKDKSRLRMSRRWGAVQRTSALLFLIPCVPAILPVDLPCGFSAASLCYSGRLGKNT